MSITSSSLPARIFLLTLLAVMPSTALGVPRPRQTVGWIVAIDHPRKSFAVAIGSRRPVPAMAVHWTDRTRFYLNEHPADSWALKVNVRVELIYRSPLMWRHRIASKVRVLTDLQPTETSNAGDRPVR